MNKKQRQQTPESERIRREEKLIELQEEFENLYQQCQYLLETASQSNKQEKLVETMNIAKQWIKKINDPNDPFINANKNTSIINGFRQAIKEIIGLLKILCEIEDGRKDLNKLDLEGAHNRVNHALSQEIKNSERRVLRMRAGVKLNNVLQEQLKQKMQKIQKVRLETIDMEVVKKKDEVGALDKTAIIILEQMEPKKQQKMKPTMNDNFNQQKEKVEQLLKQYIQVNGQNEFDFQNKYANLFNYFKERFKLANLYIGDEQIKQFLRQNQLIIEKHIAKNNNNQSKPIDNDKLYLKDLDAKHFIQDQELDKNSNTIKKILRVNQEIKKELMEEDHEERLKMIDDFKIQQKQNYWEKMLDDDPPKQRMQSQEMQRSSKRILVNRPQTNQMTKSDAFLRKTRIAHTSSLKKKTIFYQAHPNFPLIKQVYNDQDENILQQEQQIKNYVIGPDMKRIKKVEQYKGYEQQQQQKFLTSFQENMFFSKVILDPKKVKTPNQIYKQDNHTTMQSEVCANQGNRQLMKSAGVKMRSHISDMSNFETQDHNYKLLSSLYGQNWMNYENI